MHSGRDPVLSHAGRQRVAMDLGASSSRRSRSGGNRSLSDPSRQLKACVRNLTYRCRVCLAPGELKIISTAVARNLMAEMKLLGMFAACDQAVTDATRNQTG